MCFVQRALLDTVCLCLFAGKKAKQSVLTGDSDDDGGANTYDYTDSFIDDEDPEGGEFRCKTFSSLTVASY